ncbi:uncharacterized protein LOC134823196 [Bolinopsis microptera]|uniref:uncharacterized protein LOC134823196 n=1 Tax=Bolinopsis microptera TaxID=2820187 RepID=UPI00307B0AD4
MMEIDDVVATVSEIRSSIHNSHNGPDSSFLAAGHVTKPAISSDNGHVPGLKDSVERATSAVQTFLVLDTNVLIHDLLFVEELLELSNQERTTVVIPWIVLQELDGLKSTSNVGKAARKAIDYLLECRKSRREGVVFEPNSKIRTELADDRILLCLEGICDEDENCAAVLVSCDKNLRLKADVNGFESYGISELRNMLGSSDGDRSPDLHSSSSTLRTFGRMRRTDPTEPTSVKPRRPKPSSVTTPPRRPKPSSVTTSPQIQVTSTTAVRIGRSSPGDYPSTRQPTNVDPNSFHDISTNRKDNVDPYSFHDISTNRKDNVDPNSFHDISTNKKDNVDPYSFHDISTNKKDISDPLSRDNITMGRSGSKSPPSSPIDMRLAMFTGETSPKPEPRSDIARFDKSVLQVLDDMSGSMTVFKQQVVTFVEQKLSVPGPGITVQLTELQNFLSVLIPDVNKFLDSCRAFHQVPVSQLKNNFSAVCDLVSAIQSFSVHHLHYAPNIAASDAFVWLVEPGHVNHLSSTERHFTGLLAEIERAVEALMARKQFV